MEDKVTLTREEYNKLKMQANIDVNLLKQFVQSLKDIKEGKVRRVK